jgi:hypothetical protein
MAERRLPRGVHFEYGKYKARVRIGEKRRVLGCFDDPIAASRCYEEYKKQDKIDKVQERLRQEDERVKSGIEAPTRIKLNLPPGVSYRKDNAKRPYMAYTQHGQSRSYNSLGSFTTPEEAAAVAAKKRQELQAAKVVQQLEEEIRAGGGPGKIPLRDRFGKIRAFALVSQEDEAPVRQHQWHLAQHPDSDSSYAQTNIAQGKTMKMHHFIIGKPTDKGRVNHINGDGLDNRRENLRHTVGSTADVEHLAELVKYRASAYGDDEIERNNDGIAVIYPRVGDEALVDDGMWRLLSQCSWSVEGWGYATTHTNGSSVFMQTLVWTLAHGPVPEGLLVDHIANGRENRLDNRMANLRLNTRGGNMHNRAKAANASSRYSGVSLVGGRWQASIMFEGTPHLLGCFHREENAARAYNTAAIRFYGDKANLNRLDEPAEE